MPAEAGIHGPTIDQPDKWVPACAGTTTDARASLLCGVLDGVVFELAEFGDDAAAVEGEALFVGGSGRGGGEVELGEPGDGDVAVAGLVGRGRDQPADRFSHLDDAVGRHAAMPRAAEEKAAALRQAL